MPSRAPHHRPGCPVRCIVRIDEYGSEDRAKDASRYACDGVPCLRPVPTLMWRRTTAFPSSATNRTSAVIGAFDTRGGSRLYRSRADLGLHSERRTAKRAAFQKTGMPWAATTHEGDLREEISLSGLRAGSLAHAAHTFSPSLWKVLWLGIASVTVRSPTIRDGSTRRWFESTDAFLTP